MSEFIRNLQQELRVQIDQERLSPDRIIDLLEMLDDLVIVGSDERIHDPRCLFGKFCRCHRLRRLLHPVRGVQCDRCQDTGVIGDPLGPDMGRHDVINCPECAT